MKYHFKVHRDSKQGYWAECIELDGCFTQGNTMAELRANMEEALALYVQEVKGEDFLAPLPDRSIECSRSVVEVPLDPKVAFSLLLRHERRKRGLTQQEARELMGFRNLYSYQRLEREANPTLEMLGRILSIFPQFPLKRAFS